MKPQLPSHHEIFYQSQLFDGLSREHVEQLYKLAKETRFSANNYIIHEHDPALDLFIIVDGEVNIMKNADIQATLSVGESFGEVALTDKESRTACAIAVEETICLTIAVKDIRHLAKKQPIYYSILSQIADNWSNYQNCSKGENIITSTTLFKNLPKDKVNKLYSLCKEVRFKKDHVIVHENDFSVDLFIIIKGAVEISKSNPRTGDEHRLTRLGAGDTIGEMSLFDEGTRSATVRTTQDTVTLAISLKDFRALVEADPFFKEVMVHMAKSISFNLRETNKTVVSVLEQQIEEYKARVSIGHVLIGTISILCLYVIAFGEINYLTSIMPTDSFITIALTMWSLFFFIYIAKMTNYSLETFGINTTNWRKAVKEGVLFTIPILILMTLIKLILMLTVDEYKNLPFLDFYGIIISDGYAGNAASKIWLSTFLIYIFFISPIQELVARGCLQTSLQLFLAGPNRNIQALICSNLIFGTTHMFLSFSLTLASFCIGLFWGWMYTRHNNIIGTSISHALIGAWGFWFLGFKI